MFPEIAQRISSSLVRVLLEQRRRDEHHPGRAEAALQPVLGLEPLLNRVQRPVLHHSLDRGDLTAVRLHREEGARLDRRAVEPHGARPAARRVAADVRPGQAERLAQEVDEQQARLDVDRVRHAVDGDFDIHGLTSPPPGLSSSFSFSPSIVVSPANVFGAPPRRRRSLRARHVALRARLVLRVGERRASRG